MEIPRSDLERLAAIARERTLWVFSDEAYEDMVFNGEHVSSLTQYGAIGGGVIEWSRQVLAAVRR